MSSKFKIGDIVTWNENVVPRFRQALLIVDNDFAIWDEYKLLAIDLHTFDRLYLQEKDIVKI